MTGETPDRRRAIGGADTRLTAEDVQEHPDERRVDPAGDADSRRPDAPATSAGPPGHDGRADSAHGGLPGDGVSLLDGLRVGNM